MSNFSRDPAADPDKDPSATPSPDPSFEPGLDEFLDGNFAAHDAADDAHGDEHAEWPESAADPTAGAAAPPTYWQLSRMPLTSLVFTLPLVLAYEGGVLLLGRGTPRNGADVWLRHLLDELGFGSYFLLPALTILGLLAWHHIEHDRWKFSPGVLCGMAGECLLWAMGLVGVARLQEELWPLAAGAAWNGIFARMIGYCGAGLYEEVLFRLILLPVVVWGLRRLGAGPTAAGCWGILLTSAVFSLAHYVGPLGDTFQLYSFVFRMLAGGFFAVVFLLRGFGIAAGTHATYDMLVGLL